MLALTLRIKGHKTIVIAVDAIDTSEDHEKDMFCDQLSIRSPGENKASSRGNTSRGCLWKD